jgi:hypothetical protein
MIEDSTPGFNLIDGSPTDSEGRHVHGNDGRDRQVAVALFGASLAAAQRQGP